MPWVAKGLTVSSAAGEACYNSDGSIQAMATGRWRIRRMQESISLGLHPGLPLCSAVPCCSADLIGVLAAGMANGPRLAVAMGPARRGRGVTMASREWTELNRGAEATAKLAAQAGRREVRRLRKSSGHAAADLPVDRQRSLWIAHQKRGGPTTPGEGASRGRCPGASRSRRCTPAHRPRPPRHGSCVGMCRQPRS